jgi:hypothetical protein
MRRRRSCVRHYGSRLTRWLPRRRLDASFRGAYRRCEKRVARSPIAEPAQKQVPKMMMAAPRASTINVSIFPSIG